MKTIKISFRYLLALFGKNTFNPDVDRHWEEAHSSTEVISDLSQRKVAERLRKIRQELEQIREEMQETKSQK
jgi:predicted mannosyl-3-phosphoglycerate phosphatase (HAD superfamily)